MWQAQTAPTGFITWQAQTALMGFLMWQAQTAPTGFLMWQAQTAPTGFIMSKPLPSSLVTELRRGYYAAVSFVDAEIGKVTAELPDVARRPPSFLMWQGDRRAS